MPLPPGSILVARQVRYLSGHTLKVVVARESGRKLVASNRKARHDYHIVDVYEAGLVLSGTEVKSLRAGRASLVDGFASVEGGEAWLEHVHIPEYTQGTWTNHPVRRRRKLLLHREEIDRLGQALREKGFTLVPLSLYFLDGRAKVELAVARGKREYDKRQTLREQQDAREAQRAISARRDR
jgi:SsrA-binding protein